MLGGFGLTLDMAEGLDNGIYVWFGQWCSYLQEKSSNYLELKNLLEGLEVFLKTYPETKGSELFSFTDNIIADAAFWKGNFTSKKLFEIVLAIKLLAIRYCF